MAGLKYDLNHVGTVTLPRFIVKYEVRPADSELEFRQIKTLQESYPIELEVEFNERQGAAVVKSGAGHAIIYKADLNRDADGLRLEAERVAIRYLRDMEAQAFATQMRAFGYSKDPLP